MSTDDTMRRIEDALDDLLNAYDAMDTVRADIAHATLLATIRAALQPDAGGWGEDDNRHRANEEHERAVEAWREEAGKFRIWSEPRRQWFYDLDCAAFDEALRLMRWQPKTTNTETTDG